MAYSTGTYNYVGSQWQFPSGTAIYGCQVISYPEMSVGERIITNHAIPAVQRMPNGVENNGDFVLSLVKTPGVLATLKTAKEAGTINVNYLTDPIGGMLFSGWIKSLQEESADMTQEDTTAMLTVTVTPVGQISLVGGH